MEMSSCGEEASDISEKKRQKRLFVQATRDRQKIRNKRAYDRVLKLNEARKANKDW